MSRAEVWSELTTALASVTPEQDRRLHALGIPTEARLMCGTARIQPEGKFYQPDADGTMAVIIPIIEGEVIVDLIAFQPAWPELWWLRRGEAPFLGGDALEWLWLDEPPLVFKTPLAWLKAGAPHNGIAILDWSAARRHLLDTDIVATDIAFGRELKRRLTIPARRPRVHVPKRAA